MDILCHGKSLDGSPCRRHAQPGRKSCAHHDAEKAEQRARELEEAAARIRAGAVREDVA